MEAATLARSGIGAYAQALREALRARSRVFWILAGLTAAAAVLRFATLGLQAYHHDEIVTASRVLRGDFWHAMDAVGFSESAPPLYYALAWAWTQLTGTGEVGLRSLSALAGVATVPVAFLIGRELSGERTGLFAAALVAVNPMLLWYSQEARAYSLFAFLCAISMLYFVRALDRGRQRDLRAWGLASGLALATHYFALFPLAVEALWLLAKRGRRSLAGIWVLAAFGLALAPLLIRQASYGHAEWIGNFTLGHRVWESFVTFAVGETGDIIARPERPALALLPLGLMLAALLAIGLRGEARERRRAAIPLALAAATVVVPTLLALLAPSKDYVLGRNLLPALVPLLIAVAVGATLRRAPALGRAIAALLLAYSLAFCVWAAASPNLQRPDWRAVAEQLGAPRAPRAMVTWTLGEASLRYYLSSGAFQVVPSEGHRWLVHEVDLISDGAVPPPPQRLLGPAFHPSATLRAGRLRIQRYLVRGPGLAPLRMRLLRGAGLGFRNNGVLLDGIGPGA